GSVRGCVARFAERLLGALEPEVKVAPERQCPDPCHDLDRVFEETQSQRRLVQEQARQQAEAVRRRQEAEAYREGLRDVFEAAFRSAEKLEEDPSREQERMLLTEQVVAIGQRIEVDGLGERLDHLPNRQTPWTAHFLPLRFAAGLLQLGRRNR